MITFDNIKFESFIYTDDARATQELEAIQSSKLLSKNNTNLAG